MPPERRAEIERAVKTMTNTEASCPADSTCIGCIPELLTEIDALQRPLRHWLGPTIVLLTSRAYSHAKDCQCGDCKELTRLRTLCGEKGK